MKKFRELKPSELRWQCDPKFLKFKTVNDLRTCEGIIVDFHVTHCGDDLDLIITHKLGEDAGDVHKMAWDIFVEGTNIAKELKLYGAGQDLLKDAFSGNVKGMGPAVAELEFDERPNEPFLMFAADKTDPGAYNLPRIQVSSATK